jgi:hypothetical protein
LWDDLGNLCCFCCCCGKLSAIDAAFAAGILGRRRSANKKPAAALAVFRCFWEHQRGV